MAIMNLKKIISNSENESYYIFADTAFIHQGDIKYLKDLIYAVHSARCDAIKFQLLFKIDDSYSRKLDHYDEIRSWCFSQDEWLECILYAKSLGLEVILLPIDPSALDFCIDNLNLVEAIEIHSISLNEIPMLEKIKTLTNIPILLGIGGRTIDEIDFALSYIDPKNYPILMYGIQNFPTIVKNITLSKIQTLKSVFRCTLGYADHTHYNDSYNVLLIEYAYILGARVFEKHIALESGVKRVDYEAAVSVKDLLEIRERLDRLVSILGKSTRFLLANSDMMYRKREKKLVYANQLHNGEIISAEVIKYIVHPEESDFEQKDYLKIIGKMLSRDVCEGDPVKTTDFHEN